MRRRPFALSSGAEWGARVTVASRELAMGVNQLSGLYGDKPAVDRVSFDVERSEVFGFLGPNGAGKTTTIKMLTTLLQPSSGGANVLFFFFSSRRRHTRLQGDWSSDVCSSD